MAFYQMLAPAQTGLTVIVAPLGAAKDRKSSQGSTVTVRWDGLEEDPGSIHGMANGWPYGERKRHA